MLTALPSLLSITVHVRFPDQLANTGTGNNYGMEITFEQFLHRGFYFLITTSLYNSTYVGSDGIERQTAFDGDYVINALVGKRIQVAVWKKKVAGRNTSWWTPGSQQLADSFILQVI